MEKEDGVNIIGAWTLGKNREFSGRFLFCMEFPSPQLLSKLSRNLHVWVTVLLVLQFFFFFCIVIENRLAREEARLVGCGKVQECLPLLKP